MCNFFILFAKTFKGETKGKYARQVSCLPASLEALPTVL